MTRSLVSPEIFETPVPLAPLPQPRRRRAGLPAKHHCADCSRPLTLQRYDAVDFGFGERNTRPGEICAAWSEEEIGDVATRSIITIAYCEPCGRLRAGLRPFDASMQVSAFPRNVHEVASNGV